MAGLTAAQGALAMGIDFAMRLTDRGMVSAE
ncbi:electron transfer flavoprotein alpha/beta subunit [Rhizobium viscosum]|uniref:Electron transfer flavoprotein alpha/beta subunit n=1 Tax=Rhizobium viscosum TaxID=1673 RepID=A0ABR9IYB2_RHIVS|nr:electron transfer flavoprotein alpha/beta subunit [Rhizobium viscosum]